MKRHSIAIIVVVAIALAACGGGGGSSSTTPITTVTTPSTNPVSITTSGLAVGFQGQAYGDTIFGANGKAPYTFSAQGLPPGITLVNQGTVAGLGGTPSAIGSFPITVTVSDSSSPATTASKLLNITVIAAGTVRNDTLANANAITCCGTIRASLSPYSTAAGVAMPDQDYYRFTATAGDRISVTTAAIATAVDTDTVIEILDVNGTRMTTCKTPQVPAAFNQSCLNDDINPGIIRNSHLDVQLPASSGVFVVHVLDWAGRARPEMTYELRTVKLP